MNQRALTIKALESNGFIFARHGKKHDIYFNPTTRLTIPVKRHDFDDSDRRYILDEAKISSGKNKKGKRK